MRRRSRISILIFSVAAVAALGLPAEAGHKTDPHTPNLVPLGHIEEPASLFYGPPNVHTDIAFWGDHAFQGTWLGFNVRDISSAGSPSQVSFTSCEGNQGDVVVWDDILVRSWNSPADGSETCDGAPVAEGWEGLHVFDIGDLSDPALVASVDLSASAVPETGPGRNRCGSHTATAVPDLENGRLLVYSSGAFCSGIDVVEVPLDDPAAASYLRWEASAAPPERGRHCHDTGVILGDAMMAACAGMDGFSVWSLDPSDGGSLENPKFQYEVSVPEVDIGHSAAFSWDGEVIVFGHEPGGGVAAECEATDPDVKKSAMFFDSGTGDFLGMWTLPNPQTAEENCTIHNYNVVPLPSGRDLLVMGNYQAGTWVADFTDPSSPTTVAWSDPPPITPIDLGGNWSSYWYNNFIYETNITEGLNIFRLRGVSNAVVTDHLNPQTQEFTL